MKDCHHNESNPSTKSIKNKLPWLKVMCLSHLKPVDESSVHVLPVFSLVKVKDKTRFLPKTSLKALDKGAIGVEPAEHNTHPGSFRTICFSGPTNSI